MANLKQLWSSSLLFRRIVALAVFAGMAMLFYLGSHVPRSVSLPDDELNKLAKARILDEQIVLERPAVAEGELVLSYVGSRNEVADLWLTGAMLAPESRRLFGGGAQPGRISYTEGSDSSPGPVKTDDTCHTTIEVRRPQGSPAPESLRLFQTDQTAGAQRFRQIVLDPGAATLDVVVHTDSPVQGASDYAGCHKVLTIGDQQPIDLPLLPLHMLVKGGKIDLHFNPANVAVPIWTGADNTFLAVSLGDGALRAGRVEVVAAAQPKTELLNVKPSRSTTAITVKDLKVGADHLDVDLGRDGEKAVAYAKGESLYNYDVIAAIQKNPLLGFVFAGLVPAIWVWVRKNCFPAAAQTTTAKPPEP